MDISSAFFPEDGSREWSYTSDFAIRYPKTGSKAKRMVGNTPILVTYNNSVSKLGRARQGLVQTIQMARAAENNYLNKHGITNANPEDWSELIKGINEILGTKESFEYNMKKLEQLENGNIKEYADISKKLYGFLRDEAIKVVKNNLKASPASLVQEILQRGINRMRDYKVKDDTGKWIQPYYDLYKIINIGMDNNFLKSMTEIYKLEDFITKYQQYLLSGKKGKEPTLAIKGTSTYASSSVEEILSQKTMGEIAKLRASINSGDWHLTIDAQHPGPLNYKPDAILFEATYAASFESSSEEIKKDKSVRVSGVRTAEQWFKHLEEAKGDLVISSSKNYVINELFQQGGQNWKGNDIIPGFQAQSAMSLENFSSLSEELNLSEAKIDYLIDYLANLGSNMILGTTPNDNILKGIATQVGHFLFDDLSITPPVGLNVVHVFRLSGIYVPLSFVLSAVEQSLYLSIEELRQTVDVMIITGSSIPGNWSDEEFINFRNQKLKENKIKIHFLANFASILTKNVKL